MNEREPLIFVVSGEASGDILAGRLMAALKQETGGRVRFAGVGGPQSERQGLASLFPMRELSLVGIAEVIPHVPLIVRRLNETVAAARRLKPDAVVTIDSPSFTLRVARRVRAFGIPVIHYVAPQLWAWRPRRARKLARSVDHLMALLPFEVPFFANRGIPCTYVGHPAIEGDAGTADGFAFRARHNIPADAPTLLVVPGSRVSEARRTLPIFKEAVRLLKERHPNLQIVIPVATSTADIVKEVTADWLFHVVLADTAERFHAFAACDAALAKSGTVTLELALSNVPMVVAYRVNAATAFVVRRMVSVQHASLVNLLAGREVVPEFIQENCKPTLLAAALDEILQSEKARETQRRGFHEVASLIGKGNLAPSVRAARLVLDIVRSRDGATPAEPSASKATA